MCYSAAQQVTHVAVKIFSYFFQHLRLDISCFLAVDGEILSVSCGLNKNRCTCLCPGQNVRPLNKHEYILDVATEAELVDTNYSFWFRRVIWTQPLKFENELCVAMQYNQVRADISHTPRTQSDLHTVGACT